MPPTQARPALSTRETSFSLELCFLAHSYSDTVTTFISFQTVLVQTAVPLLIYHLPGEFKGFSVTHTPPSALPSWASYPDIRHCRCKQLTDTVNEIGVCL